MSNDISNIIFKIAKSGGQKPEEKETVKLKNIGKVELNSLGQERFDDGLKEIKKRLTGDARYLRANEIFKIISKNLTNGADKNEQKIFQSFMDSKRGEWLSHIVYREEDKLSFVYDPSNYLAGGKKESNERFGGQLIFSSELNGLGGERWYLLEEIGAKQPKIIECLFISRYETFPKIIQKSTEIFLPKKEEIGKIWPVSISYHSKNGQYQSIALDLGCKTGKLNGCRGVLPPRDHILKFKNKIPTPS